MAFSFCSLLKMIIKCVLVGFDSELIIDTNSMPLSLKKNIEKVPHNCDYQSKSDELLRFLKMVEIEREDKKVKKTIWFHGLVD